MADKKKVLTLLILVCFFFSGVTSLIYELLWIRMVVKIIGSAPFAVSIILTIFMAGLGLGSLIAGNAFHRVKKFSHLVILYGLLEIAAGIYCLFLPYFISVSTPLFTALYNRFFDQFLLYAVIAFMGCAVLLIFPVICMGATLPVLCRVYITSLSRVGTGTGMLYSLNTTGAALGAFICGFWLLKYFGISGTLNMAVFINSAIGILCILMGLGFHDKITFNNNSVSNQNKDELSYDLDLVCVLFIFCMSGFSSMAYEVIWTRLLGLIVGPTIYSFTIVLVTFILGIAIGSYLFGRLSDHIGRPFLLLIITQIGAAFAVLGISQLLGTSQIFFSKLIYLLNEHFAFMNLAKSGALFLFMIFPTILLGASFPLVGKITTKSVNNVGQTIGFAYAVNTIGAVAGAFLTGFILIPFLGKENSLGTVITFQLSAVLSVVAIQFYKSRSGRKKLIVVAGLTTAGIVLCFFFPKWDHFMLSTGKYHRFDRLRTDLNTLSWYDALFKGGKTILKKNRGKLVYYGDGVAGFTTVMEYKDPFGNSDFVLYNSGKAEASSRADMETQTLSAHFPLIFHENPEKVMVLGLASGITAGETLLYPVRELDVVDINNQVVDASNFFLPWNRDLFSDPRCNLIIQDGRAHLELTKKKYDVIISEPSNPWMAGLSALFTSDFFSLVSNSLESGGIFVQFIHAYEMDWDNFAMVGRTFADIFPESLLMVTRPSGNGSDYLLVGFKGKRELSLDAAKKNHRFALNSNNISLMDPTLLFRLIVSEDLPGLFGRGPLNTDDIPYLEFSAPRLIYQNDSSIRTVLRFKKWLSSETRCVVEAVTKDIDSQIDFAGYALSVYEPFKNMVDLSKANAAQKELFFSLMERYYSENTLDAELLQGELLKRCRQAQITNLEKKKMANSNTSGDRAEILNYLAGLYHDQGLFDKEIKKLSDLLTLQPDNAEAINNIGYALGAQGKHGLAIEQFKKALGIKPGYEKARDNLHTAINKLDHLKMAKTHFNLGKIFLSRKEIDKAVIQFKKALKIKPDYDDARIMLKNSRKNLPHTPKRSEARNPVTTP